MTHDRIEFHRLRLADLIADLERDGMEKPHEVLMYLTSALFALERAEKEAKR